MQMNWLEHDIFFLENSLKNIVLFAVILGLGLIFKRMLALVLSRQSFRIFKSFSHDQYREVFIGLLRKPIEQFILILVIYFSFEHLKFPESWHLVPVTEFGIRKICLITWQIMFFTTFTRIILRGTDFFTFVLVHRENSSISLELGNFLKDLIKVIIVILMIFAGLRIIFDVNLTAMVASLGIGGLAVALAAQDTLGNLLGSFVIFIDKPFKVGDFVKTTDIEGTVEHVGFRTTRVRTADKSLLTIPNKKLIDVPLNNITLSETRRVRFELGLTYSCTSEQIRAVIDDIKNILKQSEMVGETTIVRFVDFGPSSLNILVVFFVESNEYDVMIETKEKINFEIMKIVEKHGCEFAYPTQTLYLKNH